ncbi:MULTISPECIES: S-formylglutathione hydrolase [Nitrosomonas]|uniref:S-formylglutathione hydrolase n=1 Tax=Nitrosomonas communis TaxID=44574 RepID=A0A0F7KGH0_9PROT|nr:MULTISPECIES: S-formylglutathione hydrolase [Nitrosomonas]AKH38591.1 S-formylglutathione hydrolase [Nitrosomonas communis]TYP93064.1 S-formylglutathione hydrolase [Nitrosomonas communis]UVS60654.1 S-formylglutathione hydrolase [Nitrosomonas sp. PLL12]
MTTHLETRSTHRCFGGTQGFYQHLSETIGLPMRFSVYQPPQAQHGSVPVLFFLAGLTCTEETFMIKAGAQRMAAQLGIMLVSMDTSPRETGIPGEAGDWELGAGAGFYLDATEAPWSKYFRMESYVTQELYQLILSHFPAQQNRVGIFGHSMGGHGALTLALRNPDLYRSVSAFAPIAAPQHCPWGQKAFSHYLGASRENWCKHDATALIEAGHRLPALLIDQGLKDPFLAEQLQPDRFEAACRLHGQPLTIRRHDGYDHGYYFISTFMTDHLQHHYDQLSQL